MCWLLNTINWRLSKQVHPEIYSTLPENILQSLRKENIEDIGKRIPLDMIDENKGIKDKHHIENFTRAENDSLNHSQSHDGESENTDDKTIVSSEIKDAFFVK